MATKFGEGYYEIYPKINQAAVTAAREAITKGMGDAFAKEQARMRSEDDTTTKERVSNEDRVRRSRKNNSNETAKEGNALARLHASWSKRMQDDNKKTEGTLHKLATQFRTIGTVMRGLSVVSAVLGAFNSLRVVLGAISLSIPIVNAGLLVMPSLLASAGAEAIILKIAFHGVGTAIKDAFDPKKAKQYNEELKKLAPHAAQFVREIAALKNIKLPNLQETLFKQRGVQITGRQIAPAVRALAPGANKVAGASGGLLGAVGSSVTGQKGIVAFTFVLQRLAKIIHDMTPGVKKLTDGILTLIFHVSSFGKGDLGKKIGDVLGKFGDFVANVNVGQVFDKARDAASKFLSVGSDILDIIKKIVTALNGQQAFSSFGNIIHEIRNFVDSGTGQKFLSQLSNALSTLSTLSSSLTGSALQLLAGAFAAFYPAIKPLADIIAKIGKDLVPLGPVIGAIASAFAGMATELLDRLEPVIKRTVKFMTDHTQLMVGFAFAILSIWGAFKLLNAAAKAAKTIQNAYKDAVIVYKGIQAAVTVATAIWTTAQWFLNAALLANPIGLVIAAIALLIAAIAGIVFGIYELIKHWRGVWTGMKVAFDATWSALKTAFAAMKTFFTKTIPEWFLATKNWFIYAFHGVTAFVHKWWAEFVNFFTGTVKNFFVKTIPGFFLKMRDWFVLALNSVVSHLHSWWSAVANFFTGKVAGFFTHTIPSWIAKFRDWVVYYFNKVRDVARNFVNNDIIGNFNKFKNFFTKTIPDWINTFKKKAIETVKGAATGVWKEWNKVANFLWTPIKFVVDNVYNKGIRAFWNATVSKIPGVKDIPSVKMPNKAPFRTGGHVRGPGGPESDQIDARLSNNEYVIRAAKVKKYGVGFFDSINYGPEWTGDGSAGNRGRNVFDVGFKGGGVVGTIPDRVGATLAWLKSIAGRVPYVLGGNGPNSFDCSSLVGNVWARLTNNPINRRYFVTGTENAWAAHHGFSKGSDPTGFTIGTNGEHTTGILAGHRFEAAHTGTKMRFDDGAMDARKFPSVWHMTGLTGLGGGIGYDPIIDKVLKGGLKGILSGGPGTYLKKVWDAIHHIPHPGADEKGYKNLPHAGGAGLAGFAGKGLFKLADAAKKLALKAIHNLGASFGNLISNKSLTSTVDTALQAAGAPQTWFGDVLKIIRGESGGNANAQNNTDINAQRGDPSQGLMQLTHSNFEHYRSKKLPNDPFNPLANVYAGIKYIQSRYGDIKYTPWISGKGRYYSEGGLVPTLFDSGGYLPPKSMTLAANNTSNWEKVGGGGLPKTIVLDLGNNRTLEFMMDDRIAKHDNEIIQYIATR